MADQVHSATFLKVLEHLRREGFTVKALYSRGADTPPTVAALITKVAPWGAKGAGLATLILREDGVKYLFETSYGPWGLQTFPTEFLAIVQRYPVTSI